MEACLVRGSIYPDVEGVPSKQAVVMITPQGLDGVYNPSFDVTPSELITAVVTERGVAVRREGERIIDLTSVV